MDIRYKFSEVHLFFKDKKPIKRATQKNLTVIWYKHFGNELREIGVILPYC
jgi:hypothetical protein